MLQFAGRVVLTHTKFPEDRAFGFYNTVLKQLEADGINHSALMSVPRSDARFLVGGDDYQNFGKSLREFSERRAKFANLLSDQRASDTAEILSFLSSPKTLGIEITPEMESNPFQVCNTITTSKGNFETSPYALIKATLTDQEIVPIQKPRKRVFGLFERFTSLLCTTHDDAQRGRTS